jgi:FdhD protein
VTGGSIARVTIARVSGGRGERIEDAIAVERALEIGIDGRTVSVTLRTPGHDGLLALGFLAGEGLIRTRADVAAITAREASCIDQPDAVDLSLAPGTVLDWSRLERHFAATSACGLCGRAHLESLRHGLKPLPPGAPLDPGALGALPGRMRDAQATFTATGGLHAAVWCDQSLAPATLFEDVGRHNAVDKVAGDLLERGRYPADSGVLWVSGRAGAEIVIKAVRAGIPVLAAVGAPSSLAVEIAASAGLTLVGFLREGRFNVYSGFERVRM